MENDRRSLAFTEVFGSNLALFSINRYARRAEYANISSQSIRNNLQAAWVWDQDEFSVNQLGHPYQGSYYYIAGRSNNMGFWPSLALTASGSVFWEVFMETETPSRNDLVITTVGGATLGEMLHRLYTAADSADLPVKWIISPLDGINGLINGRALERQGYHGLNRDETAFTNGMGFFRNSMDKDRPGGVNVFGPQIYSEGTIVYGNPYGLRSAIPFESFEQRIRFSLASGPAYAVDYFSDGFLWAGPLREDAGHASTIGLVLHYDFIFGSLVNFSSNALGLGYKTRWQISGRTRLVMKFHAFWIILSGSEYVHVWYGNVPYREAGEEHRNYDFGTGAGIKWHTAVRFDPRFTLSFNAVLYGIRTLPRAVPENGSPGYSLAGVFDCSGEYRLAGNWSLGLEIRLYGKAGFYTSASGVFETIGNYQIFVKKQFE
jgi:hypothetical protein